MASYLSRYRDGAYKQVWSELQALGPQVRTEPLFSDAYSVASETMQRVRENIERLMVRLNNVGYTFEYPDETFTPPQPQNYKQIAELERMVGALPLSLSAWYEVVGAVCLIGTHPSLEIAESEIAASEQYLIDPLMVLPIEVALTDAQEWVGEDEPQLEEAFYLMVAPDEYHKADISGASYDILLPAPTIDAPLLGEWHNTTFVDYLRICFRWGGFPGLERFPQQHRTTDLLSYLTSDLLPL